MRAPAFLVRLACRVALSVLPYSVPAHPHADLGLRYARWCLGDGDDLPFVFPPSLPTAEDALVEVSQ